VIVVVSNTSPLIALQQIGLLGLLETLFGRVLVPPAVIREARSLTLRPEWLREHPLALPLPSAIRDAGLGAGESEALALALELKAERVLVDELAGRKLARGLGVPVVGTVGVLLAAKRRGLIPALRDPLDRLRKSGFRMDEDLYETALLQAAEVPSVSRRTAEAPPARSRRSGTLL
jgi:predicted nucleic acid-binding protein